LSVQAAVVFIVLANDRIIDGAGISTLSRTDGLILLLFFAVFIQYTISLARENKQIYEQEATFVDPLLKSSLLIVGGLAALIIGGKWVVHGAVVIARTFHVSESLIGLSIVAAGTSMPELATSTVAAFKRKPDIAVANVVGSNIFNIFFILGISALVHPVAFNGAQNFDALVCLSVSALMFLFMFTRGKKSFERSEGVMLVLVYVAYLAYLLKRG